MTTLARQLEDRWRRELAEWRPLLEPDAPVTQGSAPSLPAIYRGPDGEWAAGMTVGLLRVERVRPATYGETLDMLEQHATQYAQLEAATIECLVRFFVDGDEATQAAACARLGECWPWTTIDHTGVREAPPVLLARAEIKARVAAPEETRPRIREGMTWPEEIDRAEVVEWLAEGLERDRTGSGSRYRDWCTGVADVRVFTSAPKATYAWPDPDAILTIEPSKNILRDRTGMPDSLPFNVPTPDGPVHRLVTGEQFAWVYWAATSARSVRSHLTRIASGDAHKRLLGTIAPKAIKKEGGEPSDAAAGSLAEHVRQSVKLLIAALPSNTSSELEHAQGMDKAFAAHLEAIGARGKVIADDIRPKLEARPPGEHWRTWHRERFLVLLARALWTDVVAPDLSAPTFQLLTVRDRNGDKWGTQPKFTAAISWGMGAPGMRDVEVEGDRYAPEPRLAAKLMPRSAPLLADLKGHERKPHQTVLALEADEDMALPVAVVGATHYAISPIAAKTALLMLASEGVKRGEMQRIALGDLAKRVNPTAKRIQSRELQACSAALDELRRLFVYLPDGSKVQVFYARSARSPENAKADMDIVWGLIPDFAAILRVGIGGGTLKGAEYRGEFLINMDGAMRIPAKRPSLLRHYIRAAAHWNAAFKPGSSGEFDASMMQAYTAEQWTAMTNSLPAGVVEYLGANDSTRRTSTQRAQWSKARKAMDEELAELEATKLVTIAKEGRGRFKLLPPPVYQEAWAQSRKAGKRPPP